jgi:hypothetical protein
LYSCYKSYKAILAFWSNLPAEPNPAADSEVKKTTIALPTAHNHVASTNQTQSHPVTVGGGEQTTTTHPLIAPNPVATGGGEGSSRPMINDKVCVLWCFTQRDSTVFKVIAPVDASISRLKKLVWEECKNGVFRDTDATNLVLWKVSDKWLANSAQLTSYQ